MNKFLRAAHASGAVLKLFTINKNVRSVFYNQGNASRCKHSIDEVTMLRGTFCEDANCTGMPFL